MHYVCGFLFTMEEQTPRVTLVRKRKPVWQAGRLNGVGGKVEGIETAHAAMVREFREEAGLHIPVWRQFCTLNHDGNTVHFFMARSLMKPLKMEVESIEQHYVDVLGALPVINNLHWLIPLALSRSEEYVVANDSTKIG